MTGARIFLEALKREGVREIFGIPGGAVINIYDELHKDSELFHILTRHEQGAVHAADGYARSSGKVGVVLVTSGPGATNTVTGIATAYMDSSPIVVFTGQVPTSMIGNDAFQEADIVGITRPCTKHNYLVKDVKDLPRVIKEAFYIARTGRPGPVLVDLPKDVITASANVKFPDHIELRGYKPVLEGHVKQIRKALDIILASSRPVLYTGGGVIWSSAAADLTKFARKLKIPVTNTLMGLGGFPGDDELFMGMLGMHGTYAANMAVTHSDLIIAVGARFDDRVTGKVEEFAPEAKIVHVDVDPASISKSVKVHVPIVGDAKRVVRRLLEELKNVPQKEIRAFQKRTAEWRKKISEWKETQPLRYNRSKTRIKPQYVVEKLYELTGGDAIITTEVGQNQMWAAQFFKYKQPRTFITSGGLGTMGFGFPAAIGAQVANPGKVVVDIAGDGSIQMNIQELATAVQYRLPVKVFILNNRFLGMVRQWQHLFFDKRYSETCFGVLPDFVRLAEAYGAVGLRATRPDQVENVIKKALDVNAPVLVDFVIDREECVYPMVPAGASLKDMLLV